MSRADADNIAKKLDLLWRKHRPTLAARVEAVRIAVEAIERGAVTENLRLTGVQEAHKLAGALGTFGMPTGSAAAQMLEKLLSDRSASLIDLKKQFQSLKHEIEIRT